MKPYKVRTTLLVLVISIAANVFSQNIYYRTFDDLKQDNGTETSAWVERISLRKMKKTIKPPMKLKCNNLSERSRIKRKARFLKIGNHIYINCRNITFVCNDRKMKRYRRSRFVECLRLGNDQVVFTAVDYGTKAAFLSPNAASYIIGGLMNLAINKDDLIENTIDELIIDEQILKIASSHKACYLLKNDGINRAVKIDAVTMRLLLEPRLDLIEEYNNVDERIKESPEVIIAYLRRSGKIK